MQLQLAKIGKGYVVKCEQPFRGALREETKRLRSWETKTGSHDHSSKWVFKEKFLLSYWHVSLALFLTETFYFQLQSNDCHRLLSLGKIQQAKRFYI